MKLRKRLIAALMAVGASAAIAAPANAAFPDYSACPTEQALFCVDIVNTSGNLNIKGFNVPLSGAALAIRGGIGRNLVFLPARGSSTGFFSRPFPVPGGLLGIEWIPGTSVLAVTELAGSASDIRLNILTFDLIMPIKVRLVNGLLGMNCHIGTNANPVRLFLTTGTTNPPAPNRPISGRIGTVTSPRLGEIIVRGNLNVENSFAVPGASECGLGLGLINSLVNLKLGLPSAAGNNSTEVGNDAGILQLR